MSVPPSPSFQTDIASTNPAPTPTPSKPSTRSISGPNPLPPERREANRLAASRSRARRAERAGILSVMAKGLNDENKELKDRVDVLLGMGVKVPDGVMEEIERKVESNRLRQEEKDKREKDGADMENGEDELQGLFVPSSTVQQQQQAGEPDSTDGLHVDPDLSIPLGNQIGTRNLNQRLINHYTTFLTTLRNRFSALSETDPNTPQFQIPEEPSNSSSSSTTLKITDEGDLQISTLRTIVVALQSQVNDGKSALEGLKGQMGVFDGLGLGEEGEDVGEGGSRVDLVEKSLLDVRKRVGELLTHYNPNYSDPALPYLSLSSNTSPLTSTIATAIALTLPPKFESIPLPEPQRKGRPIRGIRQRAGNAGDGGEDGDGSGMDGGGAQKEEAPKKPRGRPKGSKNKVLPDGSTRKRKAAAAALRNAGGEDGMGGGEGHNDGGGDEPNKRVRMDMDDMIEPNLLMGDGAQSGVAPGYETEMEEMQVDGLETLAGADGGNGAGGVEGGRLDDNENDFAGLYAAQEQDQEGGVAGGQGGESSASGANDHGGLNAADASFVLDQLAMSVAGSDAAFAAQLAAIPGVEDYQNREYESGSLRNSGRGTTNNNASTSAPASGSKRYPRKGEPLRKYRIPGDDSTIYVEQTIRTPDGQEAVEVTTRPVHTSRPYTGQGKKRGPKPKWPREDEGQGQGQGQDQGQDQQEMEQDQGLSTYDHHPEDGQGEAGPSGLQNYEYDQQLQQQHSMGGGQQQEYQDHGEYDMGGGGNNANEFGHLDSLVAAAEGEAYMPSSAVVEGA